MFKPYYVSIADKRELSRLQLDKEQAVPYMERDLNASNKHYKAVQFNESLTSEMDAELKHLGIENISKMWEEMEEALLEIYKKFKGVDVNFTYCNAYRCAKGKECLRNQKHLELLEKKLRTKGLPYIESTLCVRHKHNNFVPIDVYGEHK